MQSQRLRFSGSWEEVREKLKETNIDLTDEDLDYEPGREQELLQRLQQKINLPEEAIIALIESIAVNSGKAG